MTSSAATVDTYATIGRNPIVFLKCEAPAFMFSVFSVVSDVDHTTTTWLIGSWVSFDIKHFFQICLTFVGDTYATSKYSSKALQKNYQGALCIIEILE